MAEIKRTYEKRKQLFSDMMLECGLCLKDIVELSDGLDSIGYFTMPASINHHGNYEGGLFDHSYAVAKELINLTIKAFPF